jgi:guanylate kinase
MWSEKAGKREPFLIVVSAPSGAGKTSLCKRAAKRIPKLHYGVSATTRARRPGERNGKDYAFLSPGDFGKGIREERFVEWAKVHGNLYGTPRSELDGWLAKGWDVIVDVDVQGGRSLRKLCPQAVFVFVVAPSLEAYRARLRKRGLDSPCVIRQRMENARRELAAWRKYDYLIVNRELEKATLNLEAVVLAERLRSRRALSFPAHK